MSDSQTIDSKRFFLKNQDNKVIKNIHNTMLLHKLMTQIPKTINKQVIGYCLVDLLQ